MTTFSHLFLSDHEQGWFQERLSALAVLTRPALVRWQGPVLGAQGLLAPVSHTWSVLFPPTDSPKGEGRESQPPESGRVGEGEGSGGSERMVFLSWNNRSGKASWRGRYRNWVLTSQGIR